MDKQMLYCFTCARRCALGTILISPLWQMLAADWNAAQKLPVPVCRLLCAVNMMEGIKVISFS